jgi:hypothetical protein
MMRVFLPLVVCGLLFYSCNTNPPTSPENISYPAGKIIATANINLEPSNTPADKVVLLEDFANVSCVPCVTSNLIIESLLNGSYADNIAVVKFPINWPSPYDPFYLANEEICNERIDYYDVSNKGAPTIMVDGMYNPTPSDSNAIKARIDERLMSTAPFSITINTDFQDSSLIVNINVQAINLAGINLDELKLYTIVIENDIEFDEAPGSNGEKVFYNVLRKSLPTDDGVAFSTLSDNTFNWEADLLSDWNPANLRVVSFIQNDQTKEVLQAGID